MFVLKFFFFCLAATLIRRSHQNLSIYKTPKFVHMILDASSDAATDTMACITKKKKPEMLKCFATSLLDGDVEYFVSQPESSHQSSKHKTSPKHLKDVVRFDYRTGIVVIVDAARGVTSSNLLSETLEKRLIENYNKTVVTMRWRSKGQLHPRFPLQRVVLAEIFGSKLFELLKHIIEAGGRAENIHVIGVEIGAHIAGFAANKLRPKYGKLRRITGLDPFGLEFNAQPAHYRLDKTDAKFVDCIFTKAPEISMSKPVCGANFYVNRYRKEQPGDASVDKSDRATILFTESLLPDHKFPAKKCAKIPGHGTKPKDCTNDCHALMGYPATAKLSGIYYVKTKSSYPFSMTFTEMGKQNPNINSVIAERNSSAIRRRQLFGIMKDGGKLLYDLISKLKETGANVSKCTYNFFKGPYKIIKCLITHFFQKNCDFYLFTKERPNVEHQLNVDKLDEQMEKINVDRSRKVVIILHGITSTYLHPWVRSAKQNLLANHDVNVITMDWRSSIDHILIASWMGIVPLADSFGTKLAHFLTTMKSAGWRTSQFHLVGHSLGGQVSAFAGKILKSKNEILPRITALDPAGFVFDSEPISRRLDKSDAKFVDCIFTSILSMRNPVCTANFYPNCYFKQQPGTKTTKIGGQTKQSHSRAALLFAESAEPNHKFRALKCDGLPCYVTPHEKCYELNMTTLMGYPASSKLQGIFYIKTRGSYPYVINHW